MKRNEFSRNYSPLSSISYSVIYGLEFLIRNKASHIPPVLTSNLEQRICNLT
jgi:hypothetical protein